MTWSEEGPRFLCCKCKIALQPFPSRFVTLLLPLLFSRAVTLLHHILWTVPCTLHEGMISGELLMKPKEVNGILENELGSEIKGQQNEEVHPK